MIHGEIIAPNEGGVRLIGRPHPLRSDLVSLTLPAGLSLAEMLTIAVPDAMARRHVRVFVGGEIVPPEWWTRVRPKPGAHVAFKAWVHGGGGIFRTLLSIAVLVAAPWAAGAYGAALGGLLGVGATVGAGLITAGVGIVGSLLVNAIAPPSRPGAPGSIERQQITQLPGIRGSQNRTNPYGAIPLVLGRHLVVPPLAAEPYTEIEGDDEYLRQLFVVGYGPLTITDVKIGDTPIEDFEGVTIGIREGYDSDTPLRLFPEQVLQESLSIAMPYDDEAWQTRTTADGIDEIIVEATAPSGVALISSSSGRATIWEALLQWQYRRVGTAAWINGPLLRMTDDRTETVRRGQRVEVTRGQYEVRMRRIATRDTLLAIDAGIGRWTADQWSNIVSRFVGQLDKDAEDERNDEPTRRDENRVIDEIYWTTLRGIRGENPIQFDKSIAVIAVRIRATDQLNGVIDDLSCIATSVIPDWNGESWVTRTTENPASIYRHIFQGAHLSRPLANSRMDLTTLQEWHEQCEDKGWYCNSVIGDQRPLIDVARDVASTGRAAFAMRDGKYSVRRDLPQDTPVQMFTPRNIISMTAERIFQELPHALRCQFISEEAGYQADEVIAYDDGYGADTATIFDRLELWGITDSRQARRAGRYHFATAKLRPERLTLTTDVEGLVCSQGDMVRVAHDFILVGTAQGRITALTTTEGGAVTAITLDEPCLMESGNRYAVRIRPRSDTIAGGTFFRSIVLNPGSQTTLVLSDLIQTSDAPQVGDLVAFGISDRVTSDWTVLEIAPGEQLTATLVLVPHAPGVHDADTGPVPDYNPKITIPVDMRRPSRPRIVSTQTGTDALERVGSGTRPRILARIRLPEGPGEPPIARIEAELKRSDAERWTQRGVTESGFSRVECRDVDQGEDYDLRVRSVSTFGRKSPFATLSNIRVIGKLEKPDDVRGFSIAIVGTNAALSWRPVDDVDLSHYEIRHTTRTSGATWSTSRVFRRKVKDNAIEVPLVIGTYLIKAVDTGGRKSANAAAVATTVARLRGVNFIASQQCDPAFAGTLTNLVDNSGLQLEVSAAEDIPLEIQDGTELEIQTGTPLDIQSTDEVYSLRGSYQPSGSIDTGNVYTSRVTARLLIGVLNLNEDILDVLDILAMPDVFGGTPEDDYGVETLIRTTDDDPTGSVTWSDWFDFVAGDYTARAFQFRIDVESLTPGVTPVVFEAAFDVDMPDRIERFEGVTSATGDTTILFESAFFVPPKVGISVSNGVSGDRYVQTESETGVTLRFFNSSGDGVSRRVTGVAQAYGAREI